MANIVKNIGTATGSTGTGTVTAVASTAVTGVGTAFTTELKDGNGYTLTMQVGATLYNISSITDDTHLTLTTSTTFTNSAFTIGSRNFSTIQAWEDQLPANLVTDGNSQEGDCWNDTEFLLTTTTTFSGSTTDATHNIVLTTAAGQSFKDNANVQTNPLAYDQSKGVGIRTTTSFITPLTVSEDFTSLKYLQIANQNTSGNRVVTSPNGLTANSASAILLGNIIETGTTNLSDAIILWRGGKIINNCFITRAATGDGIFSNGNNCTIVNNTIVKTSNRTQAGIGINCAYASFTIKNNAVFNFTTDQSGGTPTNTTNYTDDASPSSGFTGATMTNQFQVSTDSGHDYRLKSGADCINNGTTDATASPDIAGTARPSGASYDVGCWEFIAASGTNVYPAVWIGLTQSLVVN